MKASIVNYRKFFAGRAAVAATGARGFTLIELLVVIAIIAVLAAILLPALASAKARALRMQCMSQIKQLGFGMNTFTGDHDEKYPPAAVQYSDGSQLAWDTLISSYIGGSGLEAKSALNGVVLSADDPEDAAEALANGIALAPGKIEECPADRFPRVDWTIGPPAYARRSYAMNCTGAGGTGYGSTVQVNDTLSGRRTYPLPDLYNKSLNPHGVGIYWTDPGGMANVNYPIDWEAPGYPVARVRDPSGTILLAEVSSSMQCVGNVWCSVCCGPQTSSGSPQDWGNNFQTDVAAPTDSAKLAAGGYNTGLMLYKAQHSRFNYAFHDGHVEALKMEDTLGTASGPPQVKLQNPKGMWTVIPGD